MHMQAGEKLLNRDMVEWTLDEAGEKKEMDYFVTFPHPYPTSGPVPYVMVGLMGFDCHNNANARLQIRARKVTHSGFELVVSTWLHSTAHHCHFNWLALPSNPAGGLTNTDLD